ncbi:MAG TPA: dTMP kinase, partial [Candidatus Limnocylindrales bacterium]|nr:dTMP kinase [Candidatus Limnocylindrales bacterium]
MSVFITLEGPDGAGKSTQLELLAQRIRSLGREVVTTREPGGTELGERIRHLVLGTSGDHDGLVDALLFNAARRQLVREVIQPGLARGAVVLCDRFADSTLAYQGFGSGAPLEDLILIAEAATSGLTPTRTVLFDVDVSAGLARRLGGDHEALTKFETS